MQNKTLSIQKEPLPLTERGKSLPRAYYADSDIFELDYQTILSQQWFLVGHVSEIPTQGAYFLSEFAGNPLIVLRNEQGKIEAFHNVCQHRGSKLLQEPQGEVPRITCMYHAWTYRLDGSLLAARNMPNDFDKSACRLRNVRVEVLNGLIFLKIAENGPTSVASSLPSLAKDCIDFHGIDKGKVIQKRLHHCEGNWKLHLENFMECYHCPSSHPEYSNITTRALNIAFGTGYKTPDSGHIKDLDTAKKELEDFENLARQLGHPFGMEDSTKAESGVWSSVTRKPMKPGFKSMSQDGKPVAPLMGNFEDYDGGFTSVGFSPLSYALLSNDHAVFFTFFPVSATRTSAQVVWVVRDDAVENTDYSLENVTSLWDTTFRQDSTIVKNNWAGIQSRAYRPGSYSLEETHTVALLDWYKYQIEHR
jgi:Rieske 2Fe-2S family protein